MRSKYTETMTMRITKHQKICGVSAIDARKLLRKYDERFRENWLEGALFRLLFRRKFGHGYLYLHPEEDRSLRREAAPLIAGLVEEGFIEPDKEQARKEKNRGDNLTGKKWYKLNERGHELCNATAAKPVHRKNAGEALRGLMNESALSTRMTAFCTGSRLSFSTEVTYGARNDPPMSMWQSKWNAKSMISKSSMRLAGNIFTIPDEPVSGSDTNSSFLVLRCSSFSSNANEL
jgi:hypothetical protein